MSRTLRGPTEDRMHHFLPAILAALVLLLDPLGGARADSPGEFDEVQAVLVASDATPIEEPAPEVEAPPVPEPETPELIQRARELRAECQSLVERVERLTPQLAEADPQDERVIERQIAETKLEFLERMRELVENLEEQREAGLDESEVRAWVVARLPELSAGIVAHIETSEQKLLALRKRRVTAAPSEVDYIEDLFLEEGRWLEGLFEGHLNNLDSLDRMGLDSELARQDIRERLGTRADRLAGRLQLTVERLASLEERQVEAPDDAQLAADIRLVSRRKEVAVRAMSATVDLMDRVGLDSAAYRRLLIQAKGEVTADVFRGRVALGLLQDWAERTRAWVAEVGPGFVVKLFFFVLILLAFRLLAAIMRRIVQRTISGGGAGSSQLVNNMVLSIASRGVMLLGLLVGLSQMGVELGPLLAGLGIAGFIVGFALQDSLSNFAAGIMILGYRPFDIDDVIEAGGVFGTVSTMSLVSTTVLTFDNQTLIVPKRSGAT
jgi:small conductance mechanosensitive channel